MEREHACQTAEMKTTFCLSSTHAEDPHIHSLPPGRSPRGHSLSVILLIGKALKKHVLVMPGASAWVLILPNVQLNHTRHGSIVFRTPETERD